MIACLVMARARKGGGLRKHVRILIAGWAISALLAGAALANRAYWEDQATEAEQECRRQSGAPSEWSQFPMVCDPHVLAQSGAILVGVQDRIVEASEASSTWQTDVLSTAFLLAVLSSLPAAWYFLLDRIRELADAIRR